MKENTDWPQLPTVKYFLNVLMLLKENTYWPQLPIKQIHANIKIIKENISDILKPKTIEQVKSNITPPNSYGNIILLKNNLIDNSYGEKGFVFIGKDSLGEWKYWIYSKTSLGSTDIIRESYLITMFNDIKDGLIIDDDRSFFLFSFRGWQKVYNEIKNDYPEIYKDIIK